MTKQPTSFIVLSRGAQPILAFPSFFSLRPAGKMRACLAFQQPMKPETFLFLSIASLARIKSKSPKDMSHAAHLALHPSALIRGQLHKLPLALAKLNSSSRGPCHNTSSAHSEPTHGPYQLTSHTTLTAAQPQHYPRRRQGKLIFSYLGAAQKRRREQRKTVLCTGKCRRLLGEGNKYPLAFSLVG